MIILEIASQWERIIKMFVSIIIPTYNRAHYIKYTIDSFLKQDYPKEDYEIIVCDNNSTDNVKAVVLEYVEKYGEEKIKYMFEGRQGVHYARNSAAKVAKGDILYFTDDDMLADRNLLKELIPIFDNSRIGLATGRILPRWEKKPPKWIKKYCSNIFLSLNDLGRKTKVEEYDMGVFSCHEAIRKEAFWETGGFHPDYIEDELYGDGETGLNEDIINNGWLVGYVGKSKIFHMIPCERMTQEHINKFMANGGNADSYREYRKKVFVEKDLSLKYLRYLKAFMKDIFEIIKKTLAGKATLRFIIARFCYYRARVLYDFRVVKDKEFRKIVIMNDWLR